MTKACGGQPLWHIDTYKKKKKKHMHLAMKEIWRQRPTEKHKWTIEKTSIINLKLIANEKEKEIYR